MYTRKSKFTVSWTEKLNAQVELQNTVNYQSTARHWRAGHFLVCFIFGFTG